MEITKQSVLKALQSMSEGGNTAAVSWVFGISGTNSEVSRHLREMHELGEIKRIITYTDTVFYADQPAPAGLLFRHRITKRER